MRVHASGSDLCMRLYMFSVRVFACIVTDSRGVHVRESGWTRGMRVRECMQLSVCVCARICIETQNTSNTHSAHKRTFSSGTFDVLCQEHKQ